MQLPNDSIGPTDILSWRECPRRFEFGMRRHTEAGEHPEAQSPATAYGTAVHDALEAAGEGAADAEAIQHAFDLHARWLEPADLERMKADMATYRERAPLEDWPILANEREFRVPLMEHEGRTIFLRGRLDRLYQSPDDESVFLHIDYKSSRHAKTQSEVHSDVQMWLYNLAIHEMWPECEDLTQIYEQMNFGRLVTRKSPAQRQQVLGWARIQVTAMLNDSNYGSDGLLAPSLNKWCAFCPVLESCEIIPELTDFALTRIAALAPAEKVGRKTVLNLDPSRASEYAAELEKVGQARKALERYETGVKDLLKDMPTQVREALGYELRSRQNDVWDPEAVKAIHRLLGDNFYSLAGITKAKLEDLDGEAKAAALGMARKQPGAEYIQAKRKG